MTNMKELAEAYEPQQTKNIADLEEVSVDIEVEQRTFKEGQPDEFTKNVALINGEEYYTPNMVLGLLKEFMKEIPGLKTFKVLKKGEGMQNTRYTLIPLKVEQ